MNNEFEDIIKKLKNVKLSVEEKQKMHGYILENVNLTEAYYEYTAPKSFISRIYYKITEDYNFMFNQNKFVPTLIVALVVLATGGTSALAEKAIPGDFLYKFKVSVNEPAAGVFALTKEEKTEWKERIVERRLSEAQKLVSNNNLDESKRLELETNIQKHIDEFNTNLNELALEKNQSITSSDLNIRLQASLNAYSNVLQNLSNEQGRDEGTKNETGKFLATLSESNGKAQSEHVNLEANVKEDDQKGGNQNGTSSDSNSALGKQHAAENLLNSVKLSYQKDKVNLSANIQSQVDSKLGSAETDLADGNASMTKNDYPNALIKFQAVIKGANEAKLLMLSNVIKSDIEDDMGIKGDDGDGDIEIEEDGNTQTIENNNRPTNSKDLESLNPNAKHGGENEIEAEQDDN